MRFSHWIFLILLWTAPCWADKEPTADVTPTPTPVSISNAIPLGDISSSADTVAARLAALDAELKDDNLLWSIRDKLPPLTQEIDVRRNEDARVLQARPDLDTLRSLETNWRVLGQELPDWKQNLEIRVKRLDEELAQLDQTTAAWNATVSAAGLAGLPADLLMSAQTTVENIKSRQDALRKRRSEVVAMQNAVTRQDARVKEAMDLLSAARQRAVSNILVQDSPPMWSSEVTNRLGPTMVYDIVSSSASQVEALGAYLQRQPGKLLSPIVFFLVFYLLLSRARSWVQTKESAEGNTADFTPAMMILQSPIATAVLLSVMATRNLDPSAPRLLVASLGAIALIPAIALMRRLVEPYLWPILNALVGFYFVDQLRAITVTIPLLARLLLLLEGLAGLVFLAWFSKIGHLKLRRATATEKSSKVDIFVQVVAISLVSAAVANVLGYVALANLITNGLLGAAYLGIILYGLLRIIEGLLVLALQLRPLSMIRSVRMHTRVFQRRIMRVFRFLAGIFWALAVLEILGVREPATTGLSNILQAPIGIGKFSFSLGPLFGCIVVIYVAVLLSRFSRFILSEDIFPRLTLGKGVPYTITTTVHYAILVIGILTALAVAGVDTTKFTVVAGALSVGIGFGLQNIVNNFVSGIILLMERPVNVGDTVKLGEHQGELRRIGLRSSLLVIGDGSQVIVPNTDLINQRVVNWTKSGISRRCELKFGITLDSSPETALAIMAKVANENPRVMKTPAPACYLLGFNGRAVEMQLLAWVEDYKKMPKVRSELAVEVTRQLREAGIELIAPN
ncbi:MAG: mechanosensitive ion channel [Candidatus Eremiobacteraeota bacterium]|nr:mechanosensitive ion channel [Candidatus Eremiobacteraeota bacterium]